MDDQVSCPIWLRSRDAMPGACIADNQGGTRPVSGANRSSTSPGYFAQFSEQRDAARQRSDGHGYPSAEGLSFAQVPRSLLTRSAVSGADVAFRAVAQAYAEGVCDSV
eukprot:606170-Rhodomonas_salina.1